MHLFLKRPIIVNQTQRMGFVHDDNDITDWLAFGVAISHQCLVCEMFFYKPECSSGKKTKQNTMGTNFGDQITWKVQHPIGVIYGIISSINHNLTTYTSVQEYR